MNLQSIARALGGQLTSGHVLAPGPGHSKHDRNLAVFLDPNSPDLFRVHSFSDDDWRTCRDYVKSRLNLPDETVRRRTNFSAGGKRPNREDTSLDVSQSDAARLRYARSIWIEAKP